MWIEWLPLLGTLSEESNLSESLTINNSRTTAIKTTTTTEVVTINSNLQGETIIKQWTGRKLSVLSPLIEEAPIHSTMTSTHQRTTMTIMSSTIEPGVAMPHLIKNSNSIREVDHLKGTSVRMRDHHLISKCHSSRTRDSSHSSWTNSITKAHSSIINRYRGWLLRQLGSQISRIPWAKRYNLWCHPLQTILNSTEISRHCRLPLTTINSNSKWWSNSTRPCSILREGVSKCWTQLVKTLSITSLISIFSSNHRKPHLLDSNNNPHSNLTVLKKIW